MLRSNTTGEAAVPIKSYANIITCSRIVSAIGMIAAPPFSLWFWLSYLWGGLSDVADGLVARALNQQSPMGAKLDSIADLTFAAAIFIFAVSKTDFPNWMWIGAAFVAAIRMISYGIGLYKFKTFSSLHTYANKATGALIFGFPLLDIIFGRNIAGMILCIAALASSLEELFITAKSKELNRDCKTIWRSKNVD